MTVTLTVRVSDAAGNETVQTHSFEAGTGETILTGDIGGLVAAGTVARLRGNCRLTADLHVRGKLVADPTGVDLDGQNLFDIHTHDGGVLELIGTEKSAWVHWGDTPVGWNVGDRLAVAPTAVGIYVPSETTWQGSWVTTVRPPDSSDVTLVDGSVARPEVVNLSQSLAIRNVTRIMLHESTVPNVHTLKWLKVLNSGKSGELAFYPIHFHLLGDTCRGSVLEGVVVEGGKNHAFVPHASHGITFTHCVAYNNLGGDVFWWDPPLNNNQPDPNETHDAFYDRCLVLGATGPANPTSIRLTAFNLGRGVGNRCEGSVAAGVTMPGTVALTMSGFSWPEAGVGTWIFRDCVAHNNKYDGIFTWQNTILDHVIEDFVGYRNGRAGIEHGAYLNFYTYRNIGLTQNGQWAFINHALSWPVASGQPTKHLIIEDVRTNGPLLIGSHNQTSDRSTIYRRCTFTGVTYNETNPRWSLSVFEDCGLGPTDFTLTLIRPESIIQIYNGGMLTHQWAGGWI